MMGTLNERGDINAAALAVYVPILLTATYLIFRHESNTRMAYIYVSVLAAIKIVGAAMTIDVQVASNSNLYTPAAILSTVVLSPLLIATLEMINPGYPSHGKLYTRFFPDKPSQSFIPTNNGGIHQYLPQLFQLNRMVIIVSLALAIVGGLDAFSTDSSAHQSGKTFMRVAAGLWIAAYVLLVLPVGLLWRERSRMGNFHRRAYVVIAVGVLPLLGLRVAYVCGNAFTLGTTSTQIFNPLTGSWILYLFLAFLPEVAISVTFIAMGLKWAGERFSRV